MKYILIILIFICGSAKSQCIAGKLDTVPVFLHLTDNLSHFYYYHSNNVLMWDVKAYKIDSALLHPGDYCVQGFLVNQKSTIVNGYKVFIETDSCHLNHYRWLYDNYKAVDTVKIFVNPSFLTRAK